MKKKMYDFLAYMSYEEKKEFLIDLLQDIWEWGDDMNWKDLTEETIDQIFEVILIEDEKERDKKINGYLENERIQARKHHNNLMEIIYQIQMFDLKMKELNQSEMDKTTISDIESKILEL